MAYNENKAFDDINIINTVMNNESKQLLFNRLLKVVDTDMYQVYYRIINRKIKYDYDNMMKLNERIMNSWYLNVKDLFNIDDEELPNKLKLYMDILDAFHIQLVDLLVDYIQKNKIKSVEEISENDINHIIKLSKGQLKLILRMLDYDTIYRIITKTCEIYYTKIFVY